MKCYPVASAFSEVDFCTLVGQADARKIKKTMSEGFGLKIK
jgi:hypothetical protein